MKEAIIVKNLYTPRPYVGIKETSNENRLVSTDIRDFVGLLGLVLLPKSIAELFFIVQILTLINIGVEFDVMNTFDFALIYF